MARKAKTPVKRTRAVAKYKRTKKPEVEYSVKLEAVTIPPKLWRRFQRVAELADTPLSTVLSVLSALMYAIGEESAASEPKSSANRTYPA